jgi:hypothetical protein
MHADCRSARRRHLVREIPGGRLKLRFPLVRAMSGCGFRSRGILRSKPILFQWTQGDALKHNSANSHVRWLLDRPPSRTMTTESVVQHLNLAPMGVVPAVHVCQRCARVRSSRRDIDPCKREHADQNRIDQDRCAVRTPGHDASLPSRLARNSAVSGHEDMTLRHAGV